MTKPRSIKCGASSFSRNSNYLTFTERLRLCSFGSLTVYIIAAMYTITLRGMCGNAPMSHVDFINSISRSNVEDIGLIANLSSMYEPHKEIAARASRLAACGFWTSRKRLVPMKHLVGLIIGPIYTWNKTYCSLFCQHQGQLHAIDTLTILFNVLVLLTCHGIPPQSAASCLCILLVVYQSYSDRAKRWKSKMII